MKPEFVPPHPKGLKARLAQRAKALPEPPPLSCEPECEETESADEQQGVSTRAEPFLVIVLDEADGIARGVVVRGEHYEAAEHKAVLHFKAENDLSHLSDEAAGFRAVAAYSRECMLDFLREMELPQPLL